MSMHEIAARIEREDLVDNLRHDLYHSWRREAADEIELLRDRIKTPEQVIRSHGIPVKTYSGGVANYVVGEVE